MFEKKTLASAATILAVLMLSSPLAPLCCSQDAELESPVPPLSAAASRFADLSTRYKTLLEKFESQEADEGEAELKWFLENHPMNLLVDDFLTLEQESRGTKVGFSCLFHLVANGVCIPESQATKGKIAALGVLAKYYHNYPDVDTTFRYLFGGPHPLAPQWKIFLEDLVKSSELGSVRGNAMSKLANLLAVEADSLEQQIASLKLATPKNETQAKQFEAFAAKLKETIERNRTEALSLIEQIQRDYADELVPPAIKSGMSPKIVTIERSDIDEVLKKKRSRIIDRLAGVRFELNHSIGQPAPPIDAKDATGRPMRLADFRGKVVVVMFSFKGCAPCEAMYPENRKLIEELPEEKFAFVGVQGDETVETVKKSLDSGVITWRVWWDGKEKEISNQWNVQSWPTTFVLDPHGVIRHRNLRGKKLEAAVRSLLEKNAG